MDWLTILLLLLFAPLLWTWLEESGARIARSQLVKELEKARGSKVVTLIHKKQKYSLFGWRQPRLIDFDDAEEVLNVLRTTPPEKPIDLILHTAGGYVIAAEQIAEALVSRKGPVTAYVPYRALSGGTLVALAADEIVMDTRAILGRIDPQLLVVPAQSVKKAMDVKGRAKVTDATLVLGDMAEKALRQVRDIVWHLLTEKGYAEPVVEAITRELISETHTHDSPVFFRDAEKWGLRVKTDVPEAVYKIVKHSS